MLCLWQLLEYQQDEGGDTERERETDAITQTAVSPDITTHDRGHMCCNQTVCRLNLFNKNNDDNYLLVYAVWFKLVYVGVY